MPAFISDVLYLKYNYLSSSVDIYHIEQYTDLLFPPVYLTYIQFNYVVFYSLTYTGNNTAKKPRKNIFKNLTNQNIIYSRLHTNDSHVQTETNLNITDATKIFL